MGLSAYKRKRRFDKTPEPSGEEPARKAGDSFTIQRHAASRLHYDFRLELDGVLKSWAVPKGPSLDPSVKRLAVEVEDHPIAYGGFEGEIPKGEYGGGTVVLWDRGRWKPLADPRDGLRRGKLVFELRGKKLAGRWALVRMGARAGAASKPQWLLIKERDEHARAADEYDVTEARPESVARASARPRIRTSRRPAAARARARRPLGRDLMPAFIEPQLCTLVEAPPETDDYLHELKLDGYRIVARLEAGQARLFTRRGKDWTPSLKTLAAALERLEARQAVIDGEVVALDESGRSSFQALQNALHAPDRGVYFYAFDLLFLDGRDLRREPLLERKRRLKDLLAGARDPLRYCDHIVGGGADFFKGACELQLEGIVSKKTDSPYISGRTKQWLKSKCLRRQEFVIGGFTTPRGGRSGFGALLLGLQGERGLAFVGRVGAGFNERVLKELHAELKARARDAAPFVDPPRGAHASGVTWVEPTLVAEVAFSELTKDGILRQPSFLGIRRDKPAPEVKLEVPVSPRGGATLTHPEKVLYPEMGLTKKQLAEYYAQVAPFALAHAARRALTLVRCPGGRGRHCFFQKHVAPPYPDSVKPVEIAEKQTRTYLYIEDADGLTALVQMGALEYHPWGSTIDDLERPDVMTFDLDPGPGVGWPELVKTARMMRERLGQLGLECFVKTTGGKGLHVVVPLAPSIEWDAFKDFAKRFAEAVVALEPDRYTAKIAKAARAGKIFLDYLRNGRGATAVAAYSTRAREGATVSTPLTWEELTPRLDPASLNVRSVPRLLDRRGDPWPLYQRLRSEQKIPKEALWRE